MFVLRLDVHRNGSVMISASHKAGFYVATRALTTKHREGGGGGVKM